MKKDPFLFIKHGLIHMFKTCFGLYSTTLLFWDSGLPFYDKNTSFFDKAKRFLIPNVSSKILIFIVYLELFFMILIFLGFLGFLITSFYDKNLICILLKILPFMILFILLTLAYGVARLRLPIEPFLIILAFNFWLKILEKKVVCNG